MSVVKFAEELTQLICRWMKPVTNEDGTSSPLLTNHQIASTIRNVQLVLLGASPATPDYSSVKTPATGIEICTPTAPTVPKSNVDSANSSLGRYRSLDTLMTDDKDATLKVEDLASKSQEGMDLDLCIGNEITMEEKKYMSQSSPAINVTRVTRSNTFVRQQEKARREAEAEQGNNDTFTESESSAGELQRILRKIDELRECASNVVSRIDDVRKEVYPQSAKPIRRLSCIGGFPGTTRSSTLMRPLPSKHRRSTSGVPGTPTSSKLTPTFKAEKIKSSSRRSMAATSTVRSPISMPTNRTPSTSSMIMKKSPSTTKNPKYAHVQSTIPKPATTKRKAQ